MTRLDPSGVLAFMDQKHRIWAIRAGIGGVACALLTAWMVPDTTPTARPSVIAGMSGTAEAERPTYSAIPDSAIPSWAATLRQVPAAPQAPEQIADAGPMPDAMDAPSAPDQPVADATPPQDPAPPPVIAQADPPPAPAALQSVPRDDYQARRAQWQAKLDAVMQGQQGPG